MKELENNYSRGLYYLHYIIIRIYERLRWLRNYYYDHHYIRGILNVISNKMRKDYLEKFRNSMIRIFDRDEEGKHKIQEYSSTFFNDKEQMTQAQQR